jgi:hypothetical protein
MFYLLLFAHLVADFALQPLWLVKRKQRWDGLFIHVGLVLVCMLAMIPFEPALAALWPAMIAISAIHLLADRWKVRHADRLFKPAFVPFLIDQIIHVATLAAVLSLSLPPVQVWSPAISPLAIPAIYGSIYIVAALAAPIGLIVWLDPGFRHAAMAGAARLRSLVAAAAVLSLGAFAGPLALPLTLAGLGAVSRRPLSSHPLDRPAGMLAIFTVAAVLGALLALIA